MCGVILGVYTSFPPHFKMGKALEPLAECSTEIFVLKTWDGKK